MTGVTSITFKGEVVLSFDGPTACCGRVEWDGTRLLAYNLHCDPWCYGDGTLYRVTTQGDVVSSFPSPLDHVGAKDRVGLRIDARVAGTRSEGVMDAGYPGDKGQSVNPWSSAEYSDVVTHKQVVLGLIVRL